MGKTIKATKGQYCNGCELCVFETQRQAGKVGLEEALIRIFKNLAADPNKPVYSIDIDPRVNSQNIAKIAEICPRKVFDISQT
jgi:NAD-dependent dihydropyrimidine dehydrogenase PreA subunit